ncbi:MAG TPA: hypothetical protein VF339_11900 [Gammaproteobacteria bacterium]
MPDSPLPAEPLEQIHELNRLFLRSLQQRKIEALRSVGFPSGAMTALRQASPEQLDAIAVFPRALFEFELDAQPAGSAPQGAALDSVPLASRILELTIAYCAWTTSRDSAYHARLFFGLGADVIQALRATPLSKLPWLALTRARVVCAFRGAESLWRELLVETRPEARRQLVLVALQPALRTASLPTTV